MIADDFEQAAGSNRDFLKKPVLLQGVPERLPVRVGTVEDLQFAAPIVVKPLDAPLAVAILENLGWLSHRLKPLSPTVGMASRLRESLDVPSDPPRDP
jgi:hypothetical protein